ncbi:unnamed protein product [Callosobruchus maculatus]|uniref:Uncharacterized protein n=1 Tax=Callosobruchus maculatus TaxID=64391 RepID=A0A653D1Y3_CALMS|nr:unnamed protein product [Callosobruchus maculatus]
MQLRHQGFGRLQNFVWRYCKCHCCHIRQRRHKGQKIQILRSIDSTVWL